MLTDKMQSKLSKLITAGIVLTTILIMTQIIVFQNNSTKIEYKIDFCAIGSKAYYDELLSNSK